MQILIMQKLKTRTGYESYGLYIKYLDIVFNMWVVVSGTGEKTYQTEGDADEAIKSIIANNFGSEPVAIFIDRGKNI